MTLFRDDGTVLRTRKPGEADRIMLGPPEGHPPALPPDFLPASPPASPGGAR
jgi:hypothetical protein